jgi:hypothetical protein
VIIFLLCLNHLTPAAGFYVTSPTRSDNFAVGALYLIAHTVLFAVWRKHIKRPVNDGIAAEYITDFKL